MITEPPTSKNEGAIWMTGANLNKIAKSIKERTVSVAPRWERILIMRETEKGIQLELNVPELTKTEGKEVYFVRDGRAVPAKFLIAEITEI